MAKQVRSVDFLPEIFQTPINEQFLSATLDQLIQNPSFTQTQGFIGQRVGPGVNANDSYVIEPTKIRTDYQLEPGVVQVDGTNSQRIVDAITYPGINDALQLQGAYINNANRLYTSDYYAWDPLVDFDKFVNYAQYYWSPAGPLAIDVGSTGVPFTDVFTVTRANGTYTFSGYEGTNPELTLVRGGSYEFKVAQNGTETVNFRVTNNDTDSWNIDYAPNPTLTLIRGNTYVFDLSLSFPWAFYIKTQPSLGTANVYSNGVFNNGGTSGLITFTVPQDAPDVLYYSNDVEFNLRGQITVVNPGSTEPYDTLPYDIGRTLNEAGSFDYTAPRTTGPGFWIQTDPGINGRIPATPNISSRDVLGVINNGEDLGTVTFNVPLLTAQDYYYNMPSIGQVDLVTDLQFDQINNITVDEFFTRYPNGIDGITNLQNRTIAFVTQNGNPDTGGWQQTTFFDPLLPAGDTISGPGSYDSLLYDQTTFITDPAIQYGIWRIQYLTTEDNVSTYLSLQFVQEVSVDNKFNIGFGTQYSNTKWYKDTSGFFAKMPLLTADLGTLYYQDSTDPEIFGTIRLIDQATPPLDITKIIGSKTYNSPNGVAFSNGMQVVFRGPTIPASYQNNTYYVEGVGTAIQLLSVTEFVTPESYTQNRTVPYDSTGYDVGNYDASLNQPVVPDYITINRASPDLNAWTRSNRWVHIDVINASAAYNNTAPILDNTFRAVRPILEFRAGLRLFDSGTQSKQAVNIVDLSQTDAFTNVNGSVGYSNDGYNLIDGSTIIFAADLDPDVARTIYSVEFITPDTVLPLMAEPIILLTPVTDGVALIDQTVVSLNGNTQQGISYYYNGVNWIQAQQKISVNQPPLFDIYDSNEISFGNQATYPSSNFTGSPLFSYAIGDAAPDLVLGFPLTYLSLTNVGDIVFDNNFYSDSFKYTQNNAGQTVALSTGFARQYSNRVDFQREIGWQTAVTPSLIRQQFQFAYDGTALLLDVAVNENSVVPAVQIYANGKFRESNTYQYTVGTDTTTINLLTKNYNPGDLIEVAVLSNQVSAQGFYQVPVNLENNPLNDNSTRFTLGTVRNHYVTIAENLIDLSGPPIGANNVRDLGNVVPFGLKILQQSSPLTLTGYFMRDASYNIFASLAFNSTEYIKFKSQLLNAVTTFGIADYDNWTVAELLDNALLQVTVGRTNLNSFYWSDMLPTGTVFATNSYTVNAITTQTFNTDQVYNFATSNYLGLCVYVNNTLLTREYDYVVSTEGPTLTITASLVVGDVVTIAEYSDTAGNFVPNTPTKLGLYPKFKPEIFLDNNYVNPTAVIQGHDGSITVAFGDIRDQVLLEFEQRIFNNLKNDGNPPPLVSEDVIPGYFRSTDYTQAEINQILGADFLSWVGANKLDYTSQSYIANNEFTYNYSQAGNSIDQAPLLGAWRGVYRWFYDTTTPDTTPWEMLGFSEQPAWWTNRYGSAPYTNGNLVLWGDLEAGLVADPVAPYVIPKYRRPGLTSVIPVDDQGNLLPPFYSVMGAYNPQGFVKSWQAGDGGPVEASWWSSSSYPFAVMRLLVLTRPAEFFSLFADRDLYKYDVELNQYLYNGRYRIQPQHIQVYGNGISKASYINWIVDYNQQLALNSADSLTADLANLDVRLCYRAASFVSQKNLQVTLEKSAPQSQNDSLLIPPESYNLILYKNQPFDRINYSAVIVEVIEGGYSVYGYSSTNAYFAVQNSQVNGLSRTITGGNLSVTVPTQFTSQVTQVPYGYVFTNLASVVNFLLGYGEYLSSQGLSFVVRENGYTMDWAQMAQEFLYFAAQGWASGTVINLNPSAAQIISLVPGAVVDSIVTYTPENLLLDQNRRAFDVQNLIVYRQGNTFRLNPQAGSNQTISYLQLQFTDYEDMVVFDNVTIFNDLIYNPTTGERQQRLNLNASVSTSWNGTLNAPGFILNQDNVVAWKSNTKYTKGDIVIYKNNYWQAATIVQPSAMFDYANWYKSNYDKIQQGLLPNLANKADQLANSYNTQTANLSLDSDLLAFGLIGFRPRQYMADLNLSSTSQVQLYQQFIKTMGSRNATDLFTQVEFNNLSGSYNIYETWGIQVGTYGAQANRSWFEVALDEAVLNGNPSTFQIVQPGETSQADQAILLSNLWAESYAIPSTDILPTIYTTNLDTALPSAGYVNLDDVDITVFNLNNPSTIAAQLSTIGNGTRIWVAQENSYNWNIYKCVQVPGRITQIVDNLNGTSRAQFSTTVNLSVGDTIIIRYFNANVDGVYRVLSVPTIDSVVIAYSFSTTANQTTLVGTGITFYLQTQRVSQASDVAYLPYVNQLTAGATAWVDNDGSGHWTVLQKTNPFVNTAIVDDSGTVNSEFGQSVSQASNHSALIVGAPGNNSGAGAMYTYREGPNSSYIKNNEIALSATNVSGFGNSVDFGDSTWAAVGASASDGSIGYATVVYRTPLSGDYLITQLLLPPDGDRSAIEFGSSVNVSLDERWMYVSAPGANKVYAYGRVDVPSQSLQYVANGNTSSFNYSDAIRIDFAHPLQLLVTVNNALQVYGVDYLLTNSTVEFFDTSPANNQITLTRRVSAQLDSVTYYNVAQNSTTGAGSGAEFTVNNTRGVYVVSLTNSGQDYQVNDELTVSYVQIDPAGGVLNNLTITVTATFNGAISAFIFSGTGVGNTAVFSLTDYLYTATSYDSFTVTVNQIKQRPYIDYTFSAGTLTFVTVPATGAQLYVESALVGAYWQYVNVITATPSSDAKFGASVTTDNSGRQLLIGAPKDTARDSTGTPIANAGAVYAITRSVVRYIISNTATLTYAIPSAHTHPISVTLNNQFLTNSAQYINGQFAVVGNTVVLSNVTLTAGDILEIDTNQFQLVQKIIANTVVDQSKFGQAIDICPTNCSVYIGAPLESVSTKVIQAGMVQRQVNQSRVYGITTSTVANPALTPGDTILLNLQSVAVPASPNNTIAGLVAAINASGIPNVSATALSTGHMTVNVINLAASTAFDRLTVLPGATGTAFADIGFTTYAYTQTIVSPNPTPYAQFGASVGVNSTAENLVVGSPNGDVYDPTTFDAEKTYFDDRSTTFFGYITNSGVVYTYDYLPSADSSITNPGNFVFGQQVYTDTLTTANKFGTAVDYRQGRLVVGAPGLGVNNSLKTYGTVAVLNNPTQSPVWSVLYRQLPSVDVSLLNSVYSYNKLLNSTQTYFDYIDPLQGKILGVARRNIDYIGAVDPASYNAGTIHNIGTTWGEAHQGEIWWDTDTVRFIDANQDNLTYASRRWGQVFPGSRIDVYQWTASSSTPGNYAGPGTPLSTTSYTVQSRANDQGIITTTYYFWVKGISTTATEYGKTLSPVAVASYILNPASSGLPYIAALSANAIAIYNSVNLLSANDTILHVEYDREAVGGTDDVHTEYQFISDGKADSFLNANLYRKLLDSFCGATTTGSAVPDPLLSPGMQYGLSFRPRQSMFLNRFTALQNYFDYVNNVLAQHPIAETRNFALLNSAEPIPAANSGVWDLQVPNLEILAYQDLALVPVGYRYLVDSDSSQAGRWTIYQVQAGPTVGSLVLQLAQVQNYDTPLYWNHINWYLPGYNSSIQPLATVTNVSGLQTLNLSTAPVGSSVRVTANSQGKFEIYLRTGVDPVAGWQRVGLQDGTIAIDDVLWNYPLGNFGFDSQVFDGQYFDQAPVTETRNIIEAINQQLFTDDLLIYRNQSLMLMFQYIYSESQSPSWLIKTSYIDVDHVVRGLLPYQLYQPDNQTFVESYLTEVKPYHVQTLAFNLIYDGVDNFAGDMTDFDVPAFYNTALEVPQFVSPVLTPYAYSNSVLQSFTSDTASNAQIWLESPWTNWFNNYSMSMDSIRVIDTTSTYSTVPTIQIGHEWQALTEYTLGQQIFYGNNLYTVVVAGTTSLAQPTFTSGSTVDGTATLLYTGTAAKATAILRANRTIATLTVVQPGYGYLTTPLIGINNVYPDLETIGIKLVPVMGNNLVRSIKTTIRYDRYEYRSAIVEWQANVVYAQDERVRWKNRVWSSNTTQSLSTFVVANWTLVPADALSGVDRTMGYYEPTVNMPGLSLPLLIDGVEYPGVQVQAPGFDQNTGFDVGNYDINVFDNISYDEEGRPTYSPTILDARYSSAYSDLYLGTRPSDINVDGGGYIDTFSSYAPEELVPGSEFDTLDLRVYTRPGSDWTQRGHGFPSAQVNYVLNTATPVLGFDSLLPYPAVVFVSNLTQGIDLHAGTDYTVDYVTQTITVIPGGNTLSGNVIVINVYEIGGGNQLYKNIYNGANIGNTVTVPVAYAQIQEFVIFVNGVVVTDYSYATSGASTTTVVFDNTYTNTDSVTLYVLAPTQVSSSSPVINYSWSAPQTQYVVGDGVSLSFALANSLEYVNPDSLIVTVNGVRARTAAGIRHISDASTAYALPDRLGFDQALIADNQVRVYVNDIAQVLNVDFTVELYDNTPREVLFLNEPASGSEILIYVLTGTQCQINGNQLVFDPTGGLIPTLGDIVQVTTWNDTRQQKVLNQCIVGPISFGAINVEAYDSTNFDVGTIANDPGSFDYSAGIVITANDIDLGTVITDPDRLWVSLNGRRLFNNVDFTISGTQLILTSGILNPADVVMITQFTNFTVPEAMSFRIFQDMRGVQATYRITADTTTVTATTVAITDDVIYVDNANALLEPNLADNVWGVITIGAERIMYRYRDVDTNTVSGLLRGTAGTAIMAHAAGTTVYNMSRGNLLPAQYQNYIVSDSALGDGSTTVFTANNIDLLLEDSTIREQSLEVYVGGIRVTTGYTVTADNPAEITFDTAVPTGVDVTILVRRDVTWYAPGVGTASNGEPLQITQTPPARFLRGL